MTLKRMETNLNKKFRVNVFVRMEIWTTISLLKFIYAVRPLIKYTFTNIPRTNTIINIICYNSRINSLKC